MTDRRQVVAVGHHVDARRLLEGLVHDGHLTVEELRLARYLNPADHEPRGFDGAGVVFVFAHGYLDMPARFWEWHRMLTARGAIELAAGR